MDRQRVNLDGFAIEDPELGLTALRSPDDPAPSLIIQHGRVPVRLPGELPVIDQVDTAAAAGGTCEDEPLGHRYAVALGLALDA
jgi:propanediol dehydratase large subunit